MFELKHALPFQYPPEVPDINTFWAEYGVGSMIYEVTQIATLWNSTDLVVVMQDWDRNSFVVPLASFQEFVPGVLAPPDTPVRRFEQIDPRDAVTLLRKYMHDRLTMEG